MADRDHKQGTGWQDHPSEQPERELDAALAKYATVEPRAGLEERILANLRSQQTRAAARVWWGWSLTRTLAALVLAVALALAWRWAQPSPPQIVQHPSKIEQSPNAPQMPGVAIDEHSARQPVIRPTRTAGEHHARRSAMEQAAVAEANPKLDVFPSPRPLSEQENILEIYVNQFHQEAVLIARAQTEVEIKDQQEEMRDAGKDEEQHPSDTTIRFR